MKKLTLLLISGSLILASIACQLPFYNQLTARLRGGDPTSQGTDPLPTPIAPAAGSAIYTDHGVSIRLPSAYVLEDIENDLPALLQEMQDLRTAGGIDLLQLYEQNKEDLMLWAYDGTSTVSTPTSVLVIRNADFSGLPIGIIATFAQAMMGDSLPDDLTQEQLTLGNRSVVRFSATATVEDIQTAQVFYLFNEADYLWVIAFVTTEAQLDVRLSEFDSAVASFTVSDVE